VEAVGEPLFLTPYIEAGQLEEARQLARVDPTLLEVILICINMWSLKPVDASAVYLGAVGGVGFGIFWILNI
jgi:hypothetical protein